MGLIQSTKAPKHPKDPRYTFTCPFKDHPLDTKKRNLKDTHREPSALYCWILEILYYNPKGRRALLRTPSTEGRSVCLCWAPSKPKGPKGPIKDDPIKCFLYFLRKGVSLGYVGRIENLEDLKETRRGVLVRGHAGLVINKFS